MMASTALLYWRIPRPTPFPSGPVSHATGVVRHVETVDQLWTTTEGGQNIRRPFQMADIEFTPQGERESIHILDRVDLDSVPGMRDGSEVRISYAASDPARARIDGGTRTYPERAFTYILGWTFAFGAVGAFVVMPVIFLLDRIRSRFLGMVQSIPLDDIARKAPMLPPDDPRRKALEALLRSRQRPRRPDIQQ
jgi:hypothetical protein